jgi:hypothetical protein
LTSVRRAAAGAAALLTIIACRSSSPPSADTTRADTTRIVATPAAVPAGAPPACSVAPTDGAWSPAPVGAARFVVNRETRGMASRVRWILSPDSSALLVVDDPAGVENEAIPDGALLASERTGRVWRMDSLWSVAPAPDWRRIAVGRAVVLGGGQEQVINPARWISAAASLVRLAGPHPALRADSLRAHSFPASGMAVVEGAAATFVVDLSTGDPEPPLHFVSLGGWRVGWTCDGAALLVGDGPARVQDDAPAAVTRRVAATPGGLTTARSADSVPWIAGPTLDISVARPAGSVAVLRARGRTISTRGRQIVVVDTGAAGTAAASRVVGPGYPLAATRDGHFILAIAPRVGARPHESPDEAVVYRVP